MHIVGSHDAGLEGLWVEMVGTDSIDGHGVVLQLKHIDTGSLHAVVIMESLEMVGIGNHHVEESVDTDSHSLEGMGKLLEMVRTDGHSAGKMIHTLL